MGAFAKRDFQAQKRKRHRELQQLMLEQEKLEETARKNRHKKKKSK